MAETIIPKATAKRLPVYYRYLNFLANSGTTKISSTELSDAVKVDSATIRRDFSYFGALGKRGYGYDVKDFAQFLQKDSESGSTYQCRFSRGRQPGACVVEL